ncbi:substrate-binding domain-containing protein [Pseudoclavibacter terrae]|uniref:Transcriptional regulator LacI/GalR-like sensor domain-containing protein n=1 Tax=Pseudoclavibacter terrae TaxID=1530195 RepID=A0A7J5AXB0_9MICO|nr:hypothetical protein F8O03_17595 [Pseudoclavibacter terrae]
MVGAAGRLGLKAPEERAVLGRDNSPIASVFISPITTVHVDDERLGRYFAPLALSVASGTSATE